MSLTFMLTSRRHQQEDNTKDFARGYAAAISDLHEGRTHWGDSEEEMEMRRRRRGVYMPEDMEMRRRRSRAYGDDEMEMRGYEPRQIGFTAKAEPMDPSMVDVLEHADHVIHMPPDTWKPYVQRQDFKGIVKMEAQELMRALESGKSAKDIKKELTHTIAALMQLTKEAD